MTDLAELVERIEQLEDIHKIRNLKARYWRCIDRKLWDELEDCFTKDFVFEVAGLMEMKGRDSFMQMQRGRMNEPHMVTSHHGHAPEIEVSGDSAKGIWPVRDVIMSSRDGITFKGRGHYEDEYVKENGGWRISKSKMSYLYSEGSKTGFGQDMAVWPTL